MIQNNPLNPDPIMCEQQAAKYLSMSTRRLYQLRKIGKIAYIQDGNRIKYRQSQLDAYISRNTIRAQEVPSNGLDK